LQLTHLDAVVFEYVPAAQAVHTAAPSLGLNLPGTQRLHAPSAPHQPALQEQLDIALLPTAEYEFSGHSMHSDLSSAAYVRAVQYTQLSAAVLEYFPTAHAVHFAAPMKGLNSPGMQRLHSPLDPDQPAAQEQLVISPLPMTEYESTGHHMHADLSSDAYLPAAQYTQVTADELEIFALAQCVHAIDPLAGLYVPAAQATQSEYSPDQPSLRYRNSCTSRRCLQVKMSRMDTSHTRIYCAPNTFLRYKAHMDIGLRSWKLNICQRCNQCTHRGHG